MKETTIKGIRYRVGKLDAFKQFHIARRLAPALFELATSAAKVADTTGGPSDSVNMSELAAFKPVVEAVSKLSDEDADYVMKSCLGVVTREINNGSAWQNVLVSGRMQFEDMGLDVIMPLTMEVVSDNLGAFFNALPAR